MTRSSWRTMGLLFPLLALALATLSAEASIHKYETNYFSPVLDAFGSDLGQEGMLASTKEALQKWGNGSVVAAGTWNGQSRIDFTELTVTRSNLVAHRYRPDSGVTGVVQVVIWEQQDADKLGHPSAQGLKLCCTEALSKETGCPLNSIILRRGNAPGWPQLRNITFIGNELVARAEVPSVTIEQTGYYVMSIWTCTQELQYATIKGQASWKNPTGYLPQNVAPMLPLRCALVIAYAAVLGAWFKACYKRGSKLPEVPTAACCTAVLGFLDAVFRLAYTAALNASEWQPSMWVFFTMFAFISAWQGATRITMLLAAGGADVLPQELNLSPSVRSSSRKFSTMIRLASAYITATYIMLLKSSFAPAQPSTSVVCLVFIVSDTAIFVLTLCRLLKTLGSLRELGHPKLVNYKRFLALLVANEVCFGVAFGIGAIVGSWRTWTHNKYWRYEWLLTGGYEMIYDFFLTLAISLLFLPRKPSQGGAGRQLLLSRLDDDNSETQGLCGEDVEHP